MSFNATRRELGELYVFFRLLADGSMTLGAADGFSDPAKPWPIALIQRSEHDGIRRYYIGKDISIRKGTTDPDTGEFACDPEVQHIPREDFGEAADLLLDILKNSSADDPEVPDALEGFLNAVDIYDLEAKTEDRTDLSLVFWDNEAPVTGFCVRCRLSPMNPLLDGGRTANLKFAQTGIKFASPTVNKINALPESPNEVVERMRMIERLGGVLKYADVADRVFRCNLQMIDLHFPRMLAEMVRLAHNEGITQVSEVTERIKAINPLKIKDELIKKHGFYEHKMKQFLLALALGMRPAKIYRGTDSAVEGMLVADKEGRIVGYHQSMRNVFADFLYLHTRFEKGNVGKDKYGFLEKENGTYYFKLNVKIGLKFKN